MSYELYHPSWSEHRKPFGERLALLSASLDNRMDEDWQEGYKAWSTLESEASRGYMCGWTTMLVLLSGIPKPNKDYYELTRAEMLAGRDSLAAAVADPLEAFFSLHGKVNVCGGYGPEDVKHVAQWALEIFENGLRDNVLLYIA